MTELDKASEPWGIKVLRYEIKNINPPQDVLAAMEKQMRAEREKRAVILTSEGERDAAINSAEGQKQQAIKASEAKKAAADQRGRGRGGGHPVDRGCDGGGHPPGGGVHPVPGGFEAVQLRVAEQYIGKFGELANASDTTMIVPANVADVASMMSLAMKVVGRPPEGAKPA